VRWPDVYQAISPAEPDWRTDPGLFDLPYDPNSVRVPFAAAEVIAREWGADVLSTDEGAVRGPVLIRRMPANWSELSPAVKRAWSIERERTRAPHGASSRRWRRRRRAPDPTSAESDQTETSIVLDTELAQMIDLTDSPISLDLAPTTSTDARKGEDT
jgi:hypothetical protein